MEGERGTVSAYFRPNFLKALFTVPGFKSLEPQSGTVVDWPVSGFIHFRCDPLPFLGLR